MLCGVVAGAVLLGTPGFAGASLTLSDGPVTFKGAPVQAMSIVDRDGVADNVRFHQGTSTTVPIFVSPSAANVPPPCRALAPFDQISCPVASFGVFFLDTGLGDDEVQPEYPFPLVNRRELLKSRGAAAPLQIWLGPGDDLVGQEDLELEDGDNVPESSMVIFGGPGEDAIYARRGTQLLDGGPEDDVINIQSGDAILRGGSGNDVLSAGSGRKLMYGGPGRDSLYGTGPGPDRLVGGKGFDHCYLGSKRDRARGCEKVVRYYRTSKR